MSTWSRIAGGWALNLDGSDAARTFSLPRIEVRSSARGWTSDCFFLDGTHSSFAPPYSGGVAAAMATALDHARRLLAPGLDPAT